MRHPIIHQTAYELGDRTLLVQGVNPDVPDIKISCTIALAHIQGVELHRQFPLTVVISYGVTTLDCVFGGWYPYTDRQKEQAERLCAALRARLEVRL
jgi:hypothetical protein